MNETCGCCDGIQKLTPVTIANRPGLDALLYRVGTHASFLETMLARLSSLWICLSDLNNIQDCQKQDKIYPLRGLSTRSPDDPAIAFLDAWATVADVLTFYQERIANEGYLRTATERRSILELARLVGYTLRPGVAASVYLAYALEKDHDVVILPGNRAQSVPGPGELPQSFETAEKLETRFAWNALKPRLTRPQYMKTITRDEVIILQTRSKAKDHPIYFQGTATNLKPGDTLLFLVNGATVFNRVITVEAQAADNRTRVTVDPEPELLQASSSNITAVIMHPAGSVGRIRNQDGFSFRDVVKQLQLPPSLQPRNTQKLERSVSQAFTRQSDIHPQMLMNFSPILASTLYSAIVNAPTTSSPPQLPEVQALRVKAAPFGHNAPLQPVFNDQGRIATHKEWLLVNSVHIDINQRTLINGNPTDATISIQQDDHSWRGDSILQQGDQTLTLTEKVNGTSIEGPTVNINASPSENVFTFNIGVVPPKIHLTSETVDGKKALGVRFEPDDVKIVVPQGSSASFPTSQSPTTHHRGSIGYATDETITISDTVGTDSKILALDAQYDKIIQTLGNLVSWVVIERPDPDIPGQNKRIVSKILKVETVSVAAYGITGRVTQLTLQDDWLFGKDTSLSIIRNTTVYAQSEKRELAEEPIEEDIENTQAETLETPKVGTDTIELDKLYDGLKSGQRLIISGERTDVISAGVSVPGTRASELIMLQSVTQEVQKVPEDGNIDLPGDKKHSFLHLAKPLAYTYKRDTVTIYANVVRATHGETRTEVLGSGDGSKALQEFALRQSPLTYLAAPTPVGAESTLQVRVNDILWHEAESLAGLKPTDRSYVTETDDAGKTTAIFGNGKSGARLPTGVENVKAVYRTGIGQPGNVKAEQISLLSTKPLGVKSVINPLRASGGADKEGPDQTRRNVPLALLALDRLVSVQDYQDFARTYAGIGKASARRLSDRTRQLVHLTIAGADNIPIDTTSDLYLNLLQALRQFGDPNEPLRIDLAEVLFLVISAKVRLLPDYQLESVEPKIRSKLLDTFSFDRRQLGQPVFQSEVLSVIQNIAGVDYVDLEVMGAVDENTVIKTFDTLQKSGPDQEEEGEVEEEGETQEQEEAEEFLELLGLTGASDVIVKLAQINTSSDPYKPPTPPFLPAQLAFLSPDVPDTLIITEFPQ
jgi:Baseplate J-like protein